ncbi:MAG: cytochrome C [Proteobacteria bacterium]|nr:cytochrome C [Pseudomonadota bacterium]MBU1586140.1 cytochrome C [Pseudomonadota bacterium]MBU2455682.1 cytochrome C [Pseudomonadota bacterium]MBU2631074.1 cytochrome C [Pseudomonadota bacterium]
MGKPDQKPDYKVGKLFFLFAVMGVIALPIIIFQAFSVTTGEVLATVNPPSVLDFDHNAGQLYQTYNRTTPAYMDGSSTARTLEYYYSLRQYPGSPPFVPHDLVVEKGVEQTCISCHERGGFVESMNRFTPVTPHPQQTYCGQCHMKTVTETLFKENDWVSVRPPKLGRSALPGAPPPIVHALQMRENCIACHVGPGTVVPIRVEHPMRGNCRQCHVPEEIKVLFTRNPM